jgi:hypothetical protein
MISRNGCGKSIGVAGRIQLSTAARPPVSAATAMIVKF